MQRDKGKLEQHVFATYISLRIGMALLGFALPLVLYFGGRMFGISLQESMSDYYYAVSQNDKSMRDGFVGLIFALGAFLFLYKGFSTREDWLLNFAGLFAIGVAVFPVQDHKIPHIVSAVSFFLCIASVCFCCADETLDEKSVQMDEGRKNWYRWLYRAMAVLMLLSPVTALVFSLFLRQLSSYVYCVESAGIWAFSASWLIKSYEFRETKFERQVLRMQVEEK